MATNEGERDPGARNQPKNREVRQSFSVPARGYGEAKPVLQ